LLKKINIPLVILGFVLVGLFENSKAYAADCYPGECNPDKYVCQFGTMCCIGGGCPSWVCENNGRSWVQSRGQCCDMTRDCWWETQCRDVRVCDWVEQCWWEMQCEDPPVCSRLRRVRVCDWVYDCWTERRCDRVYVCGDPYPINCTDPNPADKCWYCTGVRPPPPPPPPPDDKYGRIRGRVWQDLDGDNIYEGTSELWADATQAACSAFQSNSMLVSLDAGVTNILESWGCNGINESYYFTSNVNLGDDGVRQVEVTLAPPSGYGCATWTYTTYDSSYNILFSGTGSGCKTGLFDMVEGDDRTHVWWKLTSTNATPTGTINGPTQLGFNETGIYTLEGRDADGNLNAVTGYRRGYDPSTGTFTTSEISLSGKVCGAGEKAICSNTVNWTPNPADGGYWAVYLNVTDEVNSRCTGSPGSLPAGYEDCGANDWILLEVVEREMNGYIWDMTGGACTADKSSNEIQPGDVDGDFEVNLDGVAGTWDPDNFADYSYLIRGFPAGVGKSLCVAKPNPVDLPGFVYNLTCLNDDRVGVISGSCAVVDVDESPEVFHLGFELISKGWFTSKDSDIFADSISLGIPLDIDLLGGFEGYLVENEGTVFAESTLTVKNPNNVDKYVYKVPPGTVNEYYVEDLSESVGDSSSWPTAGYDFEVPEKAVDVTTLGVACDQLFNAPPHLNADSSYRASASCIQDAINGLSGTYAMTANGAIVIYVEGMGDTLVFGEGNKPFRANNDNRRIVFVVEGSVEIHKDLGVADSPAMESERPLIEAVIISQRGVAFDSVGDTNGDGLSDDASVVIEGPIISRSGITFSRDRGLNNGYPAEVIHFNPKYLLGLTAQEYTNPDANYTGLFLTDLKWEVIE